jgi:hypothetical protein
LWLDFKILFTTAKVVLMGAGRQCRRHGQGLVF